MNDTSISCSVIWLPLMGLGYAAGFTYQILRFGFLAGMVKAEGE